MKVLLQQDVKGTGKAGDIVNVSDGYARNFLIPKKLAVPADSGNINAANIKKNAAKHRVEVQRKNARELASGMTDLTVRVYAKAGEGGRLFGSITGKEIAEALKAQYDISLDKKKIRIPEPIKQVGVTTVSAHMFEQTDASFKVEVIATEE
ncbi:MAG: 50S ribosomal protein L9 [Clostridia bacterium]|nr:50S ribosomal protein L9 [Clostridia bacterium]MBQ2517574.1 50S ribosomal protein L9 [Clostridia bacterium]MBQ4341604.1 50S ribosomal protein L9 [Clostridia bacterium]MBR6429331.1 50S ribosomal protein L9 [Clostridia bacterium]